MSNWDYGVGAQVAEEYHAAVAAGYCHLCILHKPATPGQPCWRCQDRIDDARYDGRYDDYDYDDYDDEGYDV